MTEPVGGPVPVDAPIPEVLRAEVEARIDDPSWVLVDVLPEASFAQAHLPGAVNLPVEEISARARHLLPDRKRETIVYCGGFT